MPQGRGFFLCRCLGTDEEVAYRDPNMRQQGIRNRTQLELLSMPRRCLQGAVPASVRAGKPHILVICARGSGAREACGTGMAAAVR